MEQTIRIRIFKSVILGTALTLVGIFGSSCSPVKFNAVSAQAQGTEAVATTPPRACNVETIYRKTKILFVVDTSASNVEATYNVVDSSNELVLTPPTDPTKNFRRGVISQFVSDYGHKTNFDWSFMTFSGDAATAYINNGSQSTPAFTPMVSEMQSALATFNQKQDVGATPYASALSLAANAIANDPDLNSPEKPNYFVVFLSDGFPTDYFDSNERFSQPRLNADVAHLVAQAPGRVSISTVFYGQVNIPAAIALLQTMASKGGGQFASVNSSNNAFKIDDVVSSSTCP